MNANQSTNPSAVSVAVLDQEVEFSRRNKLQFVSVLGGVLAGGTARDASVVNLTTAAYQKALDGNYRALVEFMRAAFSGATTKFLATKAKQPAKPLSGLWANKAAFYPYAELIFNQVPVKPTAKQEEVLRLLTRLFDAGHFASAKPVAPSTGVITVADVDPDLVAA